MLCKGYYKSLFHCFWWFQDKRFSKILDSLRLQKRGTGGVDTAATGDTFDISNNDRLGKSEVCVESALYRLQSFIRIANSLEFKMLMMKVAVGNIWVVQSENCRREQEFDKSPPPSQCFSATEKHSIYTLLIDRHDGFPEPTSGREDLIGQKLAGRNLNQIMSHTEAGSQPQTDSTFHVLIVDGWLLPLRWNSA